MNKKIIFFSVMLTILFISFVHSGAVRRDGTDEKQKSTITSIESNEDNKNDLLNDIADGIIKINDQTTAVLIIYVKTINSIPVENSFIREQQQQVIAKLAGEIYKRDDYTADDCFYIYKVLISRDGFIYGEKFLKKGLKKNPENPAEFHRELAYVYGNYFNGIEVKFAKQNNLDYYGDSANIQMLIELVKADSYIIELDKKNNNRSEIISTLMGLYSASVGEYKSDTTIEKILTLTKLIQSDKNNFSNFRSVFNFLRYVNKHSKAVDFWSEYNKKFDLVRNSEEMHIKYIGSLLKNENKKDDDICLNNIKAICAYLKEIKSDTETTNHLKKQIAPELLKILNETQENTPLTQDAATVLYELGEEGTTHTERIKIKRAQVFNELNWREGKYANEEEKKIADNFKNYSDPYRYMDLIMHQYKKKGNIVLIRPLIELIFDIQVSIDAREISIEYLGYIGESKVVPVLKKLLKVENTMIQIKAANALYQLGEKNVAFEKFRDLTKQGVFISHGILVKLGANYDFDPVPKKYLKEIILFENNPPMQILAAAYLYGLGEKDIANKVYEEIKLKLENNIIEKEMEYKTKAAINYFEKIVNWLNWKK